MSSVEIFDFNTKRRISKEKIGSLIPVKRPINDSDLLEILIFISMYYVKPAQ